MRSGHYYFVVEVEPENADGAYHSSAGNSRYSMKKTCYMGQRPLPHDCPCRCLPATAEVLSASEILCSFRALRLCARFGVASLKVDANVRHPNRSAVRGRFRLGAFRTLLCAMLHAQSRTCMTGTSVEGFPENDQDRYRWRNIERRLRILPGSSTPSDAAEILNAMRLINHDLRKEQNARAMLVCVASLVTDHPVRVYNVETGT